MTNQPPNSQQDNIIFQSGTNIRRRLRLLFLFTIVVMLGLVIYSSYLSEQFHRYGNQLSKDMSAKFSLIQQLETNFTQELTLWKNILLRGNENTQYTKNLSAFYTAEREFRDTIKSILPLMNSDSRTTEYIKEIQTAHSKWGRTARNALRTFNNSDVSPHIAADNLTSEIETSLNQLFSKLKSEARKERSQLFARIDREHEQQYKQFILLSVLIVFAFGLFIIWRIDKDVGKPAERSIKLENELRQSEVRFRTLVETSSDWIWEIDTQDCFAYVSPKIKDLLGYEPEEIIGKSAFDLMAPEEAQQVNDVYLKLIENHQPFSGMINVNLHKDGYEVILESNGVPLFDEQGKWCGYRGIDRDITERVQEHNETLTIQSRLNEAQSMAKIGSWELDLVTNYLWWSDENFRIFGFEPGKFGASYEAFLDAIHPDDRDMVNEAYTSSLETKQPYRITHRLLFKDGSIKYVHERCETLYDDKGQAILSKGTAQDVTDQVLAEQALKESESRFHTLARLAPVGIFQTDAEGQCNYVNETWLTFADMKYDEALGLGWTKALHPEDKQAVFEAWNISVEKNKPFSMEYRFLHSDETSLWVYGQADAHRDENNKIINYVGTITNIDERKRAELEHIEAQRRMRKQQRATLVFAQKQKHTTKNLNLVYRQINETIAGQLNIARVSIWFLNEAHNILRCEDLFTTHKNQHETGMILSIQDYPGYFSAMLSNQVISADDANSHKDTHEFSDDYLKPNSISSLLDAPLRDGSGNVIGVLCLEHIGDPRHWYPDEENFVSSIADMLSLSIELHARKLTEVKLKIYQDHLEQMVEQRTHELEESNQELESFTYSVSHDLRTPLRGIDGFSRLLLDKYGNELDETGKDYLHRVRNGAQRMGLLINDMLQLSRANKQEIVLETCNLSYIAEQSINELKQAEPECQIEIQITPELEVESDPKMMSIVLDNLLGNAWKFSNKKDHACIEFGILDDADESIYFVRDNGAGFDMQYADKLFQVFQRLHSTDEYPGTGVGLSTVARLIKRLGGRIWAESELGKGATFYFTPNNNEK